MGLTTEEIGKIDAALATLRGSLEAELDRRPGRPVEALDDVFLNKIAESYLSEKGVLMLMADARRQGGARFANCVCGCSCAQPNQGPMGA